MTEQEILQLAREAANVPGAVVTIANHNGKNADVTFAESTPIGSKATVVQIRGGVVTKVLRR